MEEHKDMEEHKVMEEQGVVEEQVVEVEEQEEHEEAEAGGLGGIRVTVSRFDSVTRGDETDARPLGMDGEGGDKMNGVRRDEMNETDVTRKDETDAIRIGKKEFFGKHHEEELSQAEFSSLPGDHRPPGMQEVTQEEREMQDKVVIDKEDVYPSSAPRAGLCLVVENDMFHTGLGLSKRKGSSLDRILMVNTFTKLGFEVRVYQNLTCADISSTLEKTGLEDHGRRDTLAVVILSHGNEGIFYGYDGAYPAHKVWQPFTADRCPSLAGKPKLFFIQACQGNRMDKGVEVSAAPGGRTATDGFASYRTPLHADFLLAHSTVAGYYSWRNTASGSWFIQVLGWALLTNHSSHDVATILAKVSKVVAREYESNSSRAEYNNKKQTPFLYSTLTHRLYLHHK